MAPLPSGRGRRLSIVSSSHSPSPAVERSRRTKQPFWRPVAHQRPTPLTVATTGGSHSLVSRHTGERDVSIA